MGFDTIRPLGLSGINSNIRISPNRYSIGFGSENAPDRVEFQSVGKFTTEKFLIPQLAQYPNLGTPTICNNNVITKPIIEKYAPHCVLSVNLYHIPKLKKMP